MQKQTKSKTDEAKSTDEVTVDTVKATTEHKKKERVKSRNKKKSLQGSDAVTSQQSDTSMVHVSNTSKNTTVQVHTTELLQHASVVVANLQNTSEQNSVATQEETTDNTQLSVTAQSEHNRATEEQNTENTEEQSTQHKRVTKEQKRVQEEQNTESNGGTEQTLEHTENQSTQHKRVTEEHSMEHTKEHDVEHKRSTVDKNTSQSATADVRNTLQQHQTSTDTTQKVQEKVINQSHTNHMSQQTSTSSSAASMKSKQTVSSDDDQQATNMGMKVTMEQTVSQTTSPTALAATPSSLANTNMSLRKQTSSTNTAADSQVGRQISSKDLKSAQAEMQATMEQAISQITSPTVTKSTHTTYKQQTSVDQKVTKHNIINDKTQTAKLAASQDESDSNMQTSQPSSDQKETTESDGGFNALLNELQNLSGSFDISIGSTSKQQQSTDQFQALSLFSDVPIVAPPRSSAISTTSSLDSRKETKSTVTPSKPAKPVTSTSKPTTTPAKPVTPAITTSTPASHTTVPVAVSHKEQIKQKSDGTDLEWGIDFNDIDMDLASELEELNSILGQLGGK